MTSDFYLRMFSGCMAVGECYMVIPADFSVESESSLAEQLWTLDLRVTSIE